MVVIVERSNEQMQVTKTNKHLSHSVRFVCDYFLFKIQPKLSERIKLLICVQHIPSFCLRSLFSLSVKYRNQFASHLLIDYKMIVGACTMHSSLTNLHHTHTPPMNSILTYHLFNSRTQTVNFSGCKIVTFIYANEITVHNRNWWKL